MNADCIAALKWLASMGELEGGLGLWLAEPEVDLVTVGAAMTWSIHLIGSEEEAPSAVLKISFSEDRITFSLQGQHAGALRPLMGGLYPEVMTLANLGEFELKETLQSVTKNIIEMAERSLEKAHANGLIKLSGHDEFKSDDLTGEDPDVLRRNALDQELEPGWDHDEKSDTPSNDWRSSDDETAIAQAFPSWPTSDEVLDLYGIAKRLKSNKLTNLAKARAKTLESQVKAAVARLLRG